MGFPSASRLEDAMPVPDMAWTECSVKETAMQLNCLSCGHKLELDAAYDDFEGPVKCLCGAMLNIRTQEGQLKAICLVEQPRKEPEASPEWAGK